MNLFFLLKVPEKIPGNPHVNMMWGYTMSWGYGLFFQILILIIFFLIVWWILKSIGTLPPKYEHEKPLEILKKRLAKGEITKKEYGELKKEIEK